MVTNHLKTIILALGVLGAVSSSDAAVKLPSILTDGMVVQRDQPVKIWGSADPGEKVTVKVLQGKTVSTEADTNGAWAVELPALKTGGPYTIVVNDITLSDVLSGDVFLCSGQSNMELPVSRVTDMFLDEINSYVNPSIRQVIVPKEVEFHTPLNDMKRVHWISVDSANVMQFSALAYFFAKDLYERTGVPVGIINSSWGGTPVEAWISESYLAPYPRAINEKRIYEDDAYRDQIKALERINFYRWDNTLWQSDPGMHGDVKWFDKEFDDSSWDSVDLISGESTTDGLVTGDDLHCVWKGSKWATDGYKPVNGSHWLRKNVILSSESAGKEAVLRLGCIVDADSVYVNGNFVGTTSYMYPPRIYKVPAGVLQAGDNNITVRLISKNGEAHFVPEKPYKLIVDGKDYSLEGVWRYHLGSPMPSSPGMEFYCYKPTALYNSMISPLVNLPLAGVVWYQGESNVSRRNEYPMLLETMIENWRDAFSDAGLPFYIVELADFLHPSDTYGRGTWAEMRKFQAQVADETPGVTLIKNSDLGEWNDIHPLDKKTLGHRVADAVIKNSNKK
ncbi:MAG: sialate O-acetylesterase [Muribaculum sp.]|nr:sialate O-acetylesterase [Muribaculum sp.]